MSSLQLNTSPSRDLVSDTLKGLAVFGMIQVHIVSLFAAPSLSDSFYIKIASFLGTAPVAPVLMLLLGYYVGKSERTFLQMSARAAKLFGIGLLLNIGLNANLLSSVLNDRFQADVWHYVLGVDILLFSGISILILAIIRQTTRLKLALAFALLALVLIARLFFNSFLQHFNNFTYIYAFVYGRESWSYFPLIPWLAYPLCGFLFYELKPQLLKWWKQKLSKRVLVALLSVFLIFTFNEAPGWSASLRQYYFHNIWYFIWCFSFAVVYVFCLELILPAIQNTSAFTFIQWLGRHLLIVYIVQWLIIGNLATEVYKSINSIGLLFVFFAIILFVSCCLSFFVTKLFPSLEVKGVTTS
jgi:uncharacterized membrane protein